MTISRGRGQGFVGHGKDRPMELKAAAGQRDCRPPGPLADSALAGASGGRGCGGGWARPDMHSFSCVGAALRRGWVPSGRGRIVHSVREFRNLLDSPPHNDRYQTFNLT